MDVTENETAGKPGDRWELWNLRALQPQAGLADLAALKRRQLRIRRCEQGLQATVARGDQDHFTPGRCFLAANPDLASGLIVTMHIGPYQLLPEPFLTAGITPAVLLNREAFGRLRSRAERLQVWLRVAGQLDWIPIDSPYFVRKMITALREKRPLLVFLDGNGGLGGSERTREQGMMYSLPGRDIRVRTGLGRLIARLRCPVHPLVVRWGENGEVVWRRQTGLDLDTGEDPERITRRLYDWGFGEVLNTPEQWSYWDMLKGSYACFSRSRLEADRMPGSVRADFDRAFRICLDRSPDTVRLTLTKKVEVWPGDVLANLTDDCFYEAAGLAEGHLEALGAGRQTLAGLCRRFGREWVRFHGLRLCLLDLAHLQGA